MTRQPNLAYSARRFSVASYRSPARCHATESTSTTSLASGQQASGTTRSSSGSGWFQRGSGRIRLVFTTSRSSHSGADRHPATTRRWLDAEVPCRVEELRAPRATVEGGLEPRCSQRRSTMSGSATAWFGARGRIPRPTVLTHEDVDHAHRSGPIPQIVHLAIGRPADHASFTAMKYGRAQPVDPVRRSTEGGVDVGENDLPRTIRTQSVPDRRWGGTRGQRLGARDQPILQPRDLEDPRDPHGPKMCELEGVAPIE